jgi:hypothetical protein
VNPAGEQNHRGQRHGYKEFDLMMEQAAVVKNAHGGHQSRSGHDAKNLGARRAIENNQDGHHHAPVHGQAAKKRDGFQVNFARARQVHHAHANGQGANRYSQEQ